MSAQPVSDPANVRKRRRARRVELRAKTREMGLQPFGIGIALFGPASAQKRAALQHFARSRDERGEKPELGRSEIKRVTVDARDMGLRIHAQSAYGRGGLRGGRRRGAAQQRAHARAKLLRAERLFE